MCSKIKVSYFDLIKIMLIIQPNENVWSQKCGSDFNECSCVWPCRPGVLRSALVSQVPAQRRKTTTHCCGRHISHGCVQTEKALTPPLPRTGKLWEKLSERERRIVSATCLGFDCRPVEIPIIPAPSPAICSHASPAEAAG